MPFGPLAGKAVQGAAIRTGGFACGALQDIDENARMAGPQGCAGTRTSQRQIVGSDGNLAL